MAEGKLDWERKHVHHTFSAEDTVPAENKKNRGLDVPDTGNKVHDRQSGKVM
jgi:hypothetical protein